MDKVKFFNQQLNGQIVMAELEAEHLAKSIRLLSEGDDYVAWAGEVANCGGSHRTAEGGARFGNFDGAGGKGMSEKTIYKTLAPFFDAVDGTEEKALKFTAPGYMDLCIEALGYNDHEGRPVYSVAHYGEQNGDLMRDPDVTMGVDRETGTVEPLTYQNDYIGRYWEVYKDFVDGKPTKYYPAMKKDLAAMVTAWAKNIKAQGFNPAVHA